MAFRLALLIFAQMADAGSVSARTGGEGPGSHPEPTGDARESIQSEASRLPTQRKAAEKGDVKAQKELGSAYSLGKGVTVDHAESARWYRKAADQGDSTAQFILGMDYEHGQGVPKDVAQAVRWFKKSSERDPNLAQFHLGYLYEHGEGVPQDYAEAARWYRKAADQGDSIAQFSMATAYYSGKGVPQDYEKAYFWANLAAARVANGLPMLSDDLNSAYAQDYAHFRDKAGNKLTRAQLLATQKRCRQWLAAFERRKTK